jgi:hypothetical protein
LDIDTDLKEKFPIVYSCPYKEDILNCFRQGHSAYSVDKWLNKKEKIISKTRLNDLKKWLDSIGYVEPKEKDEDIVPEKKEIDNLLLKQLWECAKTLDFEKMSDNVKVQFILGGYKAIFGSNIDVNANVDSKVTMSNLFDDDLIDTILDGDE